MNIPRIACVVPCYKVRDQVLDVLSKIGPEVAAIYVVDDCCPQQSGQLVVSQSNDPRVHVLFNERNLGVGGAVLRGYAAAMDVGAEIIVKIDGDNQMDPKFLLDFVAPILSGEADYVKGNRFFDPEAVSGMPTVRIIGNSVLSFLAKLSTGYWTLFDPTNGYTAVHAAIVELLPLRKISQGYFFESDMLFRLNCVGAMVIDLPMKASYSDEVSGLNILKIIPEFLLKHLRNTVKRIYYRYIVRDFSVATLELIVGFTLLAFGGTYGTVRWYESVSGISPATAGAVMLAGLPVLVGIQMILAFISFDMASEPRRALHRALLSRQQAKALFQSK